MESHFRSLATLQSLDAQKLALLRKLGITNLGDLLAYPPLRYAQFVMAAKNGLLRTEEIAAYLDDAAHDLEIDEVLAAPVTTLQGVGNATAKILSQLGLETVDDLASYPPFLQAEEIITGAVTEESDPHAPACVLPTCKKFTRNSKSFVSFFKQEEIRDLSVLSSNTSTISNLFNSSSKDVKIIYLGYSVSFLQEWIYGGIHLGEPQGSVSLFMGQDTQVSVLDWRRINTALRTEDTRVSERLSSTLFHQRAVDEVARATAEEHQHGGTSAFGANAATAGSFVAAGAVIGGVGGGISGAIAGLVIGNVANAAGGLPTLAGAAVGTAVGSIAGAAAGSLIVSGATTLGFVETDAEGDREIFARSAQNIQQRTVQNSSSLRSFWSNIVSQSVQDEQQTVRTDRVTNHNRIHALNALYFEVLNEYRLNISANDFAPILFLPFKPIVFTPDILRLHWWIIRTFLADKSLVLALDQFFLTLSSDPSPGAELAELPRIEDIKTDRVTVDLNLDGSVMEELIGAIVGTALLGTAIAAFRLLFDAGKRDNINVTIITTDGSFTLSRDQSPNSDPNFVGSYSSQVSIAIHTIESIKIKNSNSEFSILGFDLNELAFEGVSARIRIRNRNAFAAALPQIRSLEDEQTVRSQTLKISANSSKTVAWDIGGKLRSQFEAVSTQVDELTAELASDALTAAKLSNLLGFLNANKFGFTRLILQSTEREQVINVLEGVEVGGVDLSTFASTTPLGFCGNHVVLLLKNRPPGDASFEPVGVDTAKLEQALSELEQINGNDVKRLDAYLRDLLEFVTEFLKAARNDGNGSVREQQLLALVTVLQLHLGQYVAAGALATLFLAGLRLKIRAAIAAILAFINSSTKTNNSDVSQLLNYYGAVKDALTARMGRIISSSEVSLPSPAVFMEPVLSHAKGAELYDMRRNSHYDILPAPGIGVADPNVIRSQDTQLTPNIPGATLTIQNAPQFPLPTSINAALAEAGKLDLGTLITTNAATLNNTLSNLANMATELAKASAQLTGNAQEQALASAGEVAKQVSDIIQQSMQSPAPSSSPAAGPKPLPPVTQQEKSEVAREVRRINEGQGSKAQKKEQKEAVGAPVAVDKTRDYRMSIIFIDEQGRGYPEGNFTLSMDFFELGTTVDFNGGIPIEMSRGRFFFPDLITLESGRKGIISVSADIAGATIDGVKEFIFPDSPDIVFRARMLSETRKVSTTDVKTAVDQVVRESSFGAALNPIFERFLNGGLEFPFKIFKVSADGGSKTSLDLRLEYKRADSDTSTDTEGNTTVTDFEVVIPKNGWGIDLA
jgi:hypothetical protein